jgi:hypothetical protein
MRHVLTEPLYETDSHQQIGHAVFRINSFDEEYLITLPSLHIEGLITGSPYVELNKNSYIVSSTGYTAKIDYSGKGWLSGKKNTFSATLYPTGKEKEPLYIVDGQWTEDFTIKDAKTKHVVDSFSPKSNKTTPLAVAPVEAQDELESRRAWKKVADAITKGDTDRAGAEKSVIENRQREMRKKEKDEGREWDRRFFSRTEKFPIIQKLAAHAGEQVNEGQTSGVWVFDAAKANRSDQTS